MVSMLIAQDDTEDRLVDLLERCHSGETDFRIKAREFLESLKPKAKEVDISDYYERDDYDV